MSKTTWEDKLLMEAVQTYWDNKGWWVFTCAIATIGVIGLIAGSSAILATVIFVLIAILVGVHFLNRGVKVQSLTDTEQSFKTFFFALSLRERLLLTEVIRCLERSDPRKGMELLTKLEQIAHKRLATKSLLVQSGIRASLAEINLAMSQLAVRNHEIAVTCASMIRTWSSMWASD